MSQLPDQTLPTVTAIFRQYEIDNKDWRRPHLGASIIGHSCERKLWFDFRWATAPEHSGRLLRLFETGLLEEPRLIQNLRSIGINVIDTDPDTGHQIRFEMYGGHYAGSCDAIANGFLESKVYHVLEFKTANTKSFSALKKDGVKSKFLHWCQMQQYMRWAELERAYYFCVCKDTDDIYGERIKLEIDAVKRLEQKAGRIIFSQTPSFKISDSIENLECRFCDHRYTCHDTRLPEVNCRTCAMATPEQNGTWTCKGRVLCLDEQKAVHDCHVYIPDLVPLQQIDADPEKGTITYEGSPEHGNIVNGPGETLSKDLHFEIDDLT